MAYPTLSLCLIDSTVITLTWKVFSVWYMSEQGPCTLPTYGSHGYKPVTHINIWRLLLEFCVQWLFSSGHMCKAAVQFFLSLTFSKCFLFIGRLIPLHQYIVYPGSETIKWPLGSWFSHLSILYFWAIKKKKSQQICPQSVSIVQVKNLKGCLACSWIKRQLPNLDMWSHALSYKDPPVTPLLFSWLTDASTATVVLPPLLWNFRLQDPLGLGCQVGFPHHPRAGLYYSNCDRRNLRHRKVKWFIGSHTANVEARAGTLCYFCSIALVPCPLQMTKDHMMPCGYLVSHSRYSWWHYWHWSLWHLKKNK